MRQILLQNATTVLVQNATEIYYKTRQVFYCKMRQLLQIATILLQNATVVTKCDVYYKLRQCSLQGIWEFSDIHTFMSYLCMALCHSFMSNILKTF